MTHATRALQSHYLSGEGINSGSHTDFLTTQGHGGPPRISDQPNAGATSEITHTWKARYTIHAPIHSNKARWKDDYDGQIMFGDIVGLKLTDICLKGDKNPQKKTSPRKPVPTGDRTRARSLTGAHSAACSTAVNAKCINLSEFITPYLKLQIIP